MLCGLTYYRRKLFFPLTLFIYLLLYHTLKKDLNLPEYGETVLASSSTQGPGMQRARGLCIPTANRAMSLLQRAGGPLVSHSAHKGGIQLEEGHSNTGTETA